MEPSHKAAVAYLRAVTEHEDALTDGALLQRYTAGDAEAFGLLVRRHGPMVLGVCRRILGPTSDADDAFQATFIALARQATHVQDCLGGWLHRVAWRAAHKAQRAASPMLPNDVPDATDPYAHVEWRELRGILDDELARLPEELRTPLVLCYLDGRTRDEAAQQLGWSLRTLHRRLEEGRTRLRVRLARRGLAPALLAGVVAGEQGLRAIVPAELLRHTINPHGSPNATLQALIPAREKRGFLMKSMTALALGTITLLGVQYHASADPVVQVPKKDPPIERVEEPPQVPLGEAQKRAKAFAAAMNKAKDNAIAHLKKQQGEDGSWEKGLPALGTQSGGASALVLLALLEAGVPTTDVVIQKGLKYLRTVKPAGTYTVGLQTQVFCKANQKEDAEAIKANVVWLEKALSRNAGKIVGWSYTENGGGRGDGSNSRYALAGLYAAHKVGFPVANKDFWSEIAGHYLATQLGDGGWGYTTFGPATPTMTGSGLVCVAMAYDVLGKPTKESEAAATRGGAWLVQRFKIEQNNTYYYLDILAEHGRLTEQRELTPKEKAKVDWYQLGGEWLIKQQKENGSFTGGVGIEVHTNISTAFALRFLATTMDDVRP